MKSINQVRRQARRLFRLCLSTGHLDEARVRQIVQRLLQLNRRGSQALLSQFLRLVKLDRSEHIAKVESATSLSADLQANVEAGLERVYGSAIRTSFAQNPALIGGMRIQVGSDVYDGSVKAGLAALEERF